MPEEINPQSPEETKPTEQPKTPANKKRGKNAVWIVPLLVLLLIAAAGAYFTLINPKLLQQITGQPDAQAAPGKQEKPGAPEKSAKQTAVDSTLDQEVADEGIDPSLLEEDDGITDISDIDRWGLKRPCFIISYSAFSKEEKARQLRKALYDKGWNAGYYWIPDYVPGGKELYKVYVGPYKTREAARAMLKPVKKSKAGAYIEKLEAGAS